MKTGIEAQISGYTVRFAPVSFYALRHRPDARRDAEQAAEHEAGELADALPEGEGPRVEVHARGVDSPGAAEARASLQSIRGPARGNVSVQWTVRGILDCLQLATHVKPGSSLKDALAASAALFFGHRGEQLQQDIRDGRLLLPSGQLIRQSRLRLDLLNIAWQQHVLKDTASLRYVLCDASRCGGREFFVLREDSIRFPREILYNSEALLRLNLNQCFRTRLLPLTATGLGRASTVKKTANTCAVYMSETADSADFNTVRKEVRGFCTDQGAERGVCDETVRILPGRLGVPFQNTAAWMWPFALYVPGMLHIIFNALEEACKKLDVAERFFGALASLFAVFGEPDLRRKFQNDCCRTPQQKAAFETGGRHHVDWRWEFLGPALEWVADHWAFIVECWDQAKMEYSESGRLKRKVFDEVSVLVKWTPFPLLVEMFKAAGQLLERWAGALEGASATKRFGRRSGVGNTS